MERENKKKGIIIKFDEQKQKISNEFLTVMDVWCPHTHNNDVDDDGGQSQWCWFPIADALIHK